MLRGGGLSGGVAIYSLVTEARVESGKARDGRRALRPGLPGLAMVAAPDSVPKNSRRSQGRRHDRKQEAQSENIG